MNQIDYEILSTELSKESLEDFLNKVVNTILSEIF